MLQRAPPGTTDASPLLFLVISLLLLAVTIADIFLKAVVVLVVVLTILGGDCGAMSGSSVVIDYYLGIVKAAQAG